MSKTYLGDYAYETIRERILRCEYAPNTYVTEERLVSELNISRTPIRTALNALSKEHIIQIFPKKGVYITDITPDQVRNIYECRSLIEPYALRTYGNSFPKQRLKDLLSQFRKEDPDAWSLCTQDSAFHTEIIRLCHNDLLSAYYASIESLNLRLSYYACMQSSRFVQSNHEHIGIITAMLKDDLSLAEQLLRAHLDTSRNSAYDTLLQL